MQTVKNRKIGTALSLALAAFALAVLGGPASAAPPTAQRQIKPLRVRHVYAAHPYRQFARQVGSSSEYPYIPPDAIRMPGYIYVPGHGILGASCDLPSSTCDNAYRDVQ
jgi:hypothetical protein